MRLLSVPLKDIFLYLATEPMTRSWRRPRMTTTCMESIVSSILIMLEYAVIRTPDTKASNRPKDLVAHSFFLWSCFASSSLLDFSQGSVDGDFFDNEENDFDNLEDVNDNIDSNDAAESDLRF